MVVEWEKWLPLTHSLPNNAAESTNGKARHRTGGGTWTMDWATTIYIRWSVRPDHSWWLSLAAVGHAWLYRKGTSLWQGSIAIKSSSVWILCFIFFKHVTTIQTVFYTMYSLNPSVKPPNRATIYLRKPSSPVQPQFSVQTPSLSTPIIYSNIQQANVNTTNLYPYPHLYPTG